MLFTTTYLNACFKNTIALSLFVLLIITAKSKDNNWQKSPFQTKAFIENIGQLPEKIEYSAIDEGFKVHFTNNSILFITERAEIIDPTKTHNQPYTKKSNLVVVKDTLTMKWKGGNPNCNIMASSIMDEKFHFAQSSGQTLQNAKAYKKITYKNIYNNIDVEYYFHPKKGIKYNIIVNPGGNVNDIKMKYIGADIERTEDGIRLTCKNVFSLSDMNPISYHKNQPKDIVSSNYELKNNMVSFIISEYDKNQQLVIDPWYIYDPIANNIDFPEASEIESDTLGNMYVYGSNLPYTLRKFDKNGTALWTYYTPWDVQHWIGDLEVDISGNCYITPGVNDMQKIDSNGNLIWNNNIAFDEAFCLQLNPTEDKLVAAGAIHKPEAGLVNMNNGSITATNTYFYGPTDEIRALTTAPNGSFYALTVNHANDPSRLVNFSDNLASIWNVESGHAAISWADTMPYHLPMYHSLANNGNGASGPGGVNGLVANCEFIFSYDGYRLCKYDITNGDILLTINVPTGKPGWCSGLILDSCSNVYVGTMKGVNVYDENLSFLAADNSPQLPVFDLAFGADRSIYVSGDSILARLDNLMPVCILDTLTATSTLIDKQCKFESSICIDTVFGGVAPYTYEWSNGKTTNCIQNLPADIYTVTISDACYPLQKVLTFDIIGSSSIMASISADSSTCVSSNDGKAVVTVSNGVLPYSYNWSNGSSNQIAQNITSGTYTVTVSDAIGCTIIKNITVFPKDSYLPDFVTQSTVSCPPHIAKFTINPYKQDNNYYWMINNEFHSANNSNFISVNLYNNTKDILCQNIVLYSISTENCTTFTNKNCPIETYPNPSSDFSMNPPQTTIVNPVIEIFDMSEGAVNWHYEMGDGNTYNQSNFTHSYQDTGVFPITQIVENQFGCSDSTEKYVIIDFQSTLYIPNAFTPEQKDGINDTWGPVFNGIEGDNYELLVFDRWGQIVFSTYNKNEKWNGQLFNSGNNLPVGTYIYQLQYTENTGRIKQHRGSATLIR